MGRPKPVYNEIRQLRKQLDDFSRHHSGESSGGGGGGGVATIKQCRVAYSRLLEVLGDARKRQQLSDEAISDEDYMEIGTSHVTKNNNMDTDDDDDDDYPSRTRTTKNTTTRTGTTTDHWVSRSIRARQRLALSEMWKSLLTSSVQCTQQLMRLSTTKSRKRKATTGSSSGTHGASQSTTTGNTTSHIKYNEEDVNFPFKLLKLCYLFDPIFDESMLPPPMSPTFASSSSSSYMHPPPPTNFLPSKLGREQAKLLYHFCINLLTDIDQDRDQQQRTRNEEANVKLNDTSTMGAVEQIALSTLLFICGKVELVASYYKPIPHVRHIMTRVVQPRIMLLLLPSTSSSSLSTIPQQQLVLTSCKIWYELFHTCTLEDIGIGLQLLIPEAFDLFSSWCRQQPPMFHSSSSSVMVESSTYVLNTMTIIMKQDRDLCIASLQRHGYIILPFLKSCYQQYQQQKLTFATTTNISNSSIVMALHDFLLQYILVCQEAGILQGCMSCELGDVGKGSLDNKAIYMFLEVLITSVISNETSASSDKQQQQDKYRIDSAYKVLLEVTVRLLNIAQRNFLVRNEWREMEDPTQMIIDHIEQQPYLDNYYSVPMPIDDAWPTCSAAVLSESPFIKYVLSPIYNATIPSISSPTDTPTLLQQALSVENNDNTATPATAMNDRRFVAILHILCASAELYPLGSCWTTSTQNNWRLLSCKDDKSLFTTSTPPPPPYDLITMNGCSALDLATIIDVLANVLAQFGSHTASIGIQKWALRTLMRLAITTDEVCNHDSKKTSNDNSFVVLGNAWKRVWNVIYDTNYCYNARTTESFIGSVGDFVLQLLTQIMRFASTDLSSLKSNHSTEFLIGRQSDIWNLKVFEQFQIQSSSPFVLLYATVTRVGVNDLGRCSVGSSVEHGEAWQSLLRRYGKGRRSKLLCFCLHFLSTSHDILVNDAVLSVVFVCIAALINGFSVPTWWLLWVTGQLDQQPLIIQSDSTGTMPICLDNAQFPNGEVTQHEFRKKLLESIWSTRSLDINIFIATVCKPDKCYALELVEAARALVQLRVLRREFQSDAVKLKVVPSESGRFLLLVQDDLVEIVSEVNSTNSDHKDSDLSAQQLARRISIVRASLVIFLANSMKANSERLEFPVAEVTNVFVEASRFLSTMVSGNREICDVATNLILLVRGLVTMFAEGGFGTTSSLIGAASKLYDSCSEILESCVVIDSYDDIVPTRKGKAIAENFLDDDSCNSRRYINSNHNKSMRMQRSRTKQQSFRCSRSCVFLIGTLMIELNPVYKDYEFVTKRLLGVNVLGRLQEEGHVFDVIGGLYAIVTLTIKPCRTVPEMEEKVPATFDSIPMLLCKIVKAIRCASDPCSVTHFFGFHVCSAAVTNYDQCNWTESLNSTEAKELVENVLCFDLQKEWRKSLIQRPQLRSKQLLAATSAFDNACTNFHSEIDNLFGLTFVLPSLSDLIQCIRRHSFSSVIVAMMHLSEDKVVENVRKRLCPLTGHKDDAYKRWYANKIGSGGFEESVGTAESRIWNDAHPSFSFDTFLCWCAIAATTGTREVVQQILFDIISASVDDPFIEDLCFLAIERIAITSGFSNVEAFLISEMCDVSKRWVNAGWRLHQLPLMICIPSTYKCIMRARRFWEFKSNGAESSKQLDWDRHKVSAIAVVEFLRRQSKYFFPQVVVSSVNGVTQTAITKESRRRLLDNDLFKEYCSALYGSYNDEIAIKAVRTHIPMVMAEACRSDANVAENLILLLKGLLGEKLFLAKCNECTCLSFRRSIETVGQTTSYDESESIENLWVLSDLLGLKHQGSALVMMESAKCTVPELISFVRFLFESSQTDRQKISRWRSASVILRLAVDDQKSVRGFELSFCIDFLLGIINSQQQSHILECAFKNMKELLFNFTKTVGTGVNGSNSSMLKTLFATLMSFHRKSQANFMDRCIELWQYREQHRKSGATLVSELKCGDALTVSFWNWVPEGATSMTVPFSEIWRCCNRFIPSMFTEKIVMSYDLLQLVVQGSMSLNILPFVMGSFRVEPPEIVTCNQLSLINPSFSAQLLVLEFVKEKVSIDELDITDWTCINEDSGVDMAHIHMELVALEELLRSSRKQVMVEKLWQTRCCDKNLILLLISFCSGSFSESTRIVASRCLAEFSIIGNDEPGTSSISSKHVEHVDRLSTAIEQDCLVTFTQSCVVESVAASIQATDSRIALIAVDTLKLLMSTITGKRCAEWLKETRGNENLIHLVAATSMNGSCLILSENEIDELRTATIRKYTRSSKEWCWDDSFWIFDTNTSFDLWISRLVAALLVCCYEVPGKHDVQGLTDDFFSACQRICMINANVACKVFPSLVLDLLLRDRLDGDDVDAVLIDTWVGRCNGVNNDRLSRCVNLFLKHFQMGNSSRAVELVVDLLDMLRRYTQHNFEVSLHHKANKKRNRETKESALDVSVSDENINLLWHGVPYGIVLKLNGLTVANACISARRFESAIFYAELFADARFGGPQRASTVNNLFLRFSSRDISGFNTNDDENEAIEDDVVPYFEILRQCYTALGDEGARTAVDRLESDFNFSNEQESMVAISSLLCEPPSLQKLLFLDNVSMRETNAGGMRIPILNCLDDLGFHGLLETYIRGSTAAAYTHSHGALEEEDFLREKVFECTLYSKQWDDPIFRSTSLALDRDVANDIVNSEGNSAGRGFYEHLSTALDNMKCGDLDASKKLLSRARLCFVDDLTSRGSKTFMLRNMNLHIDCLRTLNDLEDYISNPESPERLQRILAPVDYVRGIPYNRSSISDCVRATVMNSVRSNERVWNAEAPKIASDLQLQFQLHLQGNRHQAAQESLYRLDSVLRSNDNHPNLRLQLRLHEAKLLEGRNDVNSAIRNTKLIIKNLQESLLNNVDKGLLADSLLLCGQWMAKHKVEPASSILANYFEPASTQALHLYGNNNDASNADRATRALLAQSQLVSNLFDAVSSRITGVDWQKAEVSLTEREVECEQLRREEEGKKTKSHSDILYRQFLEREIKSTRTQRNDIVSSLETYRTQAVKSIATALVITGDRGPEDLLKHVYRLIGILFSSENAWSKRLDEIANDAINSIPSFRFVPLVNQLLSRIATSKLTQATFQSHLQALILKLSYDHPYHCLIHLITLSESKASSVDANDKTEGANLILSKLIMKDPEFRAQLIESYRKLSHAYIHLATASTSELKQKTSKISFDTLCKTSNCRLDKCLGSGARRAPYVPCILTKPPTVCPNRDYGNGRDDPIGSELVSTFESTFTITESGVSQPKIVVCVGSSGQRFKQLVKGADDTRQDAVMEQVFGYANKILKLQRHSNSKGIPFSHELRLVTYNIVPLSHVAGVLEWVEHSTPFGDFIIDKITKASQKGAPTRKVGAHSRYFPTEWSSDRCRQVLTQLWKEYQELDGFRNETCNGVHHKQKLREAFDMIYEHHSPVFRYFFVENFATSEMWYASKMRYTRSVAVSSIVGHVLGIGDRHMNNILVHKKTGEVIHIDFGIVFEQGKRLRIPEIVPFRLTRNVVDGMGPIGVEGPFTKAAEDTLSVLKENSNGLLTILSAIVSDPLYKWSSSSKKEMRRTTIDRGNTDFVEDSLPDQGYNSIGHDGDENRNEVAAHAISRIHDKLLGYEDGTSGEQQSVESQVQLLMNAAQDPDNLCVMFVGWAPFQ